MPPVTVTTFSYNGYTIPIEWSFEKKCYYGRWYEGLQCVTVQGKTIDATITSLYAALAIDTHKTTHYGC